jgi:tetratricopeptide (TPR) repeat protein
MNKYPYLILLIPLIVVTCGFNWGFGSTGTCTKAKILTAALSELSGESRTKQEDRILKLCPDGAAGHFVLGLRHERQKETDEAIVEYRAAVGSDETLAEAHGNLGLLLLKKGARDEAAVELSKGLMGKDDTRYHLGLAELLKEGKMYSLALYHYLEALKAFPQEIQSMRGLHMFTTI